MQFTSSGVGMLYFIVFLVFITNYSRILIFTITVNRNINHDWRGGGKQQTAGPDDAICIVWRLVCFFILFFLFLYQLLLFLGLTTSIFTGNDKHDGRWWRTIIGCARWCNLHRLALGMFFFIVFLIFIYQLLFFLGLTTSMFTGKDKHDGRWWRTISGCARQCNLHCLALVCLNLIVFLILYY